MVAPLVPSRPKSANAHSWRELTLTSCDDLTGIVTFTAASKSHPGRPNHTSIDTTTGTILCDCQGAECGRDCWHVALVGEAWLTSPAILDVRWLSDQQLLKYGRKMATMAETYRARVGRVLLADALGLTASRYEWRRRASIAAPVDLQLAA